MTQVGQDLSPGKGKREMSGTKRFQQGSKSTKNGGECLTTHFHTDPKNKSKKKNWSRLRSTCKVQRPLPNRKKLTKHDTK